MADGVLESGVVYWFFRPKIGIEEAKSIDDVQKFYMLLAPSPSLDNPRDGVHSTTSTKRLLILGNKKLPAVKEKGHGRVWGFVDAVSNKIEEFEETLGAFTYQTKTRGERHVQAVRVVGEGIYKFIRHQRRVSFAYVLEVPAEPTEVQLSFNVVKEASYIISIKNPHMPGPQGRWGPGQKADVPPAVMKAFEGVRVEDKKWITADPPGLLNHAHLEVLFIGESDNLADKFADIGRALEEEERTDAELAQKDLDQGYCTKQSCEPLEGQWK